MLVFSVSLKALLKLCCILGYNNVSVAFFTFSSMIFTTHFSSYITCKIINCSIFKTNQKSLCCRKFQI